MKRYCYCFLMLLLLSLFSCTDEKSKEELRDEIDQLSDKYAEKSQFDYQKEIASWLTTETSYNYDNEKNSSNSVINLFNSVYQIHKDRLYLKIADYDGVSVNNDIWTYISIKTGEKHYLCPDPLCSHLEDSGCMYLNLEGLLFDPNTENLLYTAKAILSDQGFRYTICEIDLYQNKIQSLYSVDPNELGASFNSFALCFISDGKLYFTDTYTFKENNSDGEMVRREQTYLKALDLTDKTVTVIREDYNIADNCVYADNAHIYFINQSEKIFFATDLNFENKQTILTYEEGTQIYNLFYDRDAAAFYCSICTDSMFTASDDPSASGVLYCISSEFSCEKVPLPSEKITNFQLTDHYIYYTIYDPVAYGISPRGIDTVDETGNKIYRVQRDNLSEAELVFDGRGELFFRRDFIAAGDYIYIDYYDLMKQGDTVWFRRMGSTARINFKTNTIKWMNLD